MPKIPTSFRSEAIKGNLQFSNAFGTDIYLEQPFPKICYPKLNSLILISAMGKINKFKYLFLIIKKKFVNVILFLKRILKKKSYLFFLIAIFIIISTVLIEAVVILNLSENSIKYYTNIDTKESLSLIEGLGVSGDFIGGFLNPILSSITIFALFYSIYLQKEEIKENKIVVANQFYEIKKQNFENTFFKIIETINSIHDSLDTVERHEDIEEKYDESGTRIPQRLPEMVNHFTEIIRVTEPLSMDQSRKILQRHNHLHGKLFLLIYQALKLIFISHNLKDGERKTKSELNSIIPSSALKDQEKIYSNYLRSLLNEKILTILGINCAINENTDQYYTYRLLIERYAMLEHLKPEENDAKYLSFCEKEIFNFYASSAFGESKGYTLHMKTNKSV